FYYDLSAQITVEAIYRKARRFAVSAHQHFLMNDADGVISDLLKPLAFLAGTHAVSMNDGGNRSGKHFQILAERPQRVVRLLAARHIFRTRAKRGVENSEGFDGAPTKRHIRAESAADIFRNGLPR